MKDCTEIVLTFEGNENLDYVANNTQNIQPFHHNGHGQITNICANFNLSHNPLLGTSSLQSTTVADICPKNQNAPHDIHLMDNLYEIANDIGSPMDLDDVQTDDKMDNSIRP